MILLILLALIFFLPQILQPTRVTDHSATLIDNIFFNSLEHYSLSGNIVHDLSDHFPNFLIINKFSHLPSKTKIYKRDYSHFNDSALVNYLMKSGSLIGVLFSQILMM